MNRVSQAPDDARHVVISVNPKAGARSGKPLIDRLVEQLRRRDLKPQVVHGEREIADCCGQLLAAGSLRGLVCAGGDGTVSYAANAAPPGTPLAILPLGTENLLAKYFGVRRRPGDVAELIAAGWRCCLDAGRANGRLFTLMAGLGFDADVVRRVHEARTGHIRHLSYAKPIWTAIRTYQYPELRVSLEHFDSEPKVEQPIRARWVFVANLPQYARNIRIVPDADGTDGLLDVCTFRQGSLLKGLQYLSAILMQRHRGWQSEVQSLRVKRLRIESDEPVSYQLDGDFGGHTPLEIEVVEQCLTMIVPQRWLRRHGLLVPDSA